MSNNCCDLTGVLRLKQVTSAINALVGALPPFSGLLGLPVLWGDDLRRDRRPCVSAP